MLLKELLKAPGFLYEIQGSYYYLGKWICRKCPETDASDCAYMYYMLRNGQEDSDINLYFQKIRAYSDFALEVPCNPAKVRSDAAALMDSLPETALDKLKEQFAAFKEDLEKYASQS